MCVYGGGASQDYKYDDRWNYLKLVTKQRQKYNLAKFIQMMASFDEYHANDVDGLLEEEDMEARCAMTTGCRDCVQLFDRYPVVFNNMKVDIVKTVITLIET